MKHSALQIVYLVLTLGSVLPAYPSFDSLVRPKPTDLRPESFELVEVLVDVRDEAGIPATGGRVYAVNHDLSFCYPHGNDGMAGPALANGQALIHLPKGLCTVYAFSETPDHSYFLSTEIKLTTNQTVTLQPDAMIQLSIQDLRSNLLNDAQVWLVDARLKPLLPAFLSALCTGSTVAIGVKQDALADVLVIKRPPLGLSDGESYYLHFTNVAAGATVAFQATSNNLAHVRFDMINSLGQHSPNARCYLQTPAFSLQTTLSCWRDGYVRWDELNLWITPETTAFTAASEPRPGVTLFWNPRVVSLTPGGTHDLRAGGAITVKPWFIPSLDPRQIWLEINDQFGGAFQQAWFPTEQERSLIRLKNETGETVHEEYLFATLDKWLGVDPTDLDYELNVPLDFFGSFRLTGRCYTVSNTLPVITNQTAHFQIEWPAFQADLLPRFAALAEDSEAAISAALGAPLARRSRYLASLFGPGWTSGSTFSCHVAWLRDQTALDYPTDVFKGAFSHELAHVFQGTTEGLSNFGADALFGEAMASVLRDIAKEKAVSPVCSRLGILGHREPFWLALYRRSGYASELRLGDGEVSPYWQCYFIQSYLTDALGPEIHGRFAHLWGIDQRRLELLRVCQANGITNIYEQICVGYSLACRQNLAWLFRLGEFDVSPEKVGSIISLRSERQADTLRLRWPDSPTAFVLESTTAPLQPGSAWVPMGGTASVANGQRTLALPVTNQASLYRVRIFE